MPDFDAIIIGTGQAGPSLAFRLADVPPVWEPGNDH
jgi:pyruvate/2-oxoglutarate dehydrogenase complex dihydrolipoamide dehydrogenase (E3) component